MNKFEEAYIKMISEEITNNTILVPKKISNENELSGKSYGDLIKVAKAIAKNRFEPNGSDIICPICGKKVSKNNDMQWGCKNNDIKNSSRGIGFKVRDCSMKWHDALKSLQKQNPDDKVAIKRLKEITK
jgi:hypothetical protein